MAQLQDLFPQYFDGTLREHYLLLFGSAGTLALIIGGIAAWAGARWGARRAVRLAMDETARSDATFRLEYRLEQLAQSVDLVAVEVERIAEAQRYAARLLAERQAPPPPSRREPGQITPH
jgi:hypothetical protein